MRRFSVLTHNICFGLKSNTPWGAYNSTYRVFHGRKDPEELKRKADFSVFFAHLSRLDPDVVVINEMVDDLFTEEFTTLLKQRGYVSIFVANSGHHQKPLCVSTIVATKAEAVYVDNPMTFPGNVLGSGGGAVAVAIPSLDCCVLGCHTAFKKHYLASQIQEMDMFFDKAINTYENVLFVGDLNRSPGFYRKHSRFGKEMKAAITETTFPSFFPFYKPLSFLSENLLADAVDNVFFKGNLRLIDTKVIAGRSDHKIVYALFETQE